MDCRLICLDIDGTILNSRHEITKQVKESIQGASKRGIPVVLLSARMPKAMRFLQKELGLSDPMACFGGGLVLRGEEVLMDAVLDNETAEAVCGLAREMKIHTSVYKGDDWFVEEFDGWARQEGKITHLMPSVCGFADLFGTWKNLKTGANKLLLMAEPEQITWVMERLKKRQDIQVEMYRSKDTYLEIMPRGVGKMATVLELCKFYNITAQQVLAAGDNDNDMDMLRAAGVGAAMGNAAAHVKACGDFVTKSNDEDGVSYVIEKFVLAPKAKLVALDMDGTTLEPDKTLSPVTLAAVKKAVEQGVLVVPASGRTCGGIPQKLLELGLPYVISANGGAITDMKTGRHIYENEILYEEAVELLSELVQMEGVLYIQYQEKYYQDKKYVEKGKKHHPYAGLPDEGTVEDILGFVEENHMPVQKIGILLFDEETEKRVMAMQDRSVNLQVLKTDRLCVEFNAATASKGEALRALAAMLHIGREEVMAIGDSENDLSMICFAGKSVAMGNAMESIKNAAVYQTKPNTENGAAWAFQYIL